MEGGVRWIQRGWGGRQREGGGMEPALSSLIFHPSICSVQVPDSTGWGGGGVDTGAFSILECNSIHLKGV
jgi:hypothetical protein